MEASRAALVSDGHAEPTPPDHDRGAAPLVVLTGANGYIGRHLQPAFIAAGFRVHALVRNPRTPPPRSGVTAFAYRLERPPPAAAFERANTIVHGAADTTGELSAEEQVAAAKRVMEHAASQGARTVFLFTLNAKPSARANYARAKLAVERVILAGGGVVLRLGLVYGGEPLGFFAMLANLARSAPLVPAFVPAPRVQCVHVDDVCEAIVSAVRGVPSGTYVIAQARGIALTAFLGELAWRRHRRLLPAVPVPLALTRLAAGLTTAFRLLPKYHAERFAGLLDLATSPNEDATTDCETFRVAPRPLEVGLARGAGAYRELLEEGRALMFYICRRRPTNSTLARYARTVAGRGVGIPGESIALGLGLRPRHKALPFLIRFLDPRRLPQPPRSPQYAARRRRFELALTLAEADRHLAPTFHQRRRRDAFAAIARIGVDGAIELALALGSVTRRMVAKLAGRTVER